MMTFIFPDTFMVINRDSNTTILRPIQHYDEVGPWFSCSVDDIVFPSCWQQSLGVTRIKFRGQMVGGHVIIHVTRR